MKHKKRTNIVDSGFDREETIDRMNEIKYEMGELIDEFRDFAAAAGCSMGNLDAYVFDQLREHIHNSNPYNQSLNSIICNLEDEDEDE